MRILPHFHDCRDHAIQTRFKIVCFNKHTSGITGVFMGNRMEWYNYNQIQGESNKSKRLSLVINFKSLMP